MDYDDYQQTSAASWLGGPNGSLWSRVLGIVKDAIATATRAAVGNRFASVAHISSLPWLLEDRNLDPAWNENETSVRARIKAAWSTWQKQGRKAALEEALALAGFQNFIVLDQETDGTLNWWEFDVVLYPPYPWLSDAYRLDGFWDDPGNYDDCGSYSEALPESYVARLRAIVRRWKPSHAKCRYIKVIQSGDPWDLDAPPGQWDEGSVLWTDDVTYLSP